MGSGIRQLGLNSCSLSANGMTWGDFLTSLCLGLCTCEMRIFVVLPHMVTVGIT